MGRPEKPLAVSERARARPWVRVSKANPQIAVIGAGDWGRNLLRVFDELGTLGAICEVNPERLETCKALFSKYRFFTSYSQVLQDKSIEGVAIATPSETHGPMVRQALEAGKDVFVEKPLCLSVREGEDLVRLAEERRRILMIGHLLWYHPAILKLQEVVRSGELGRVQYIYSNRLNLGKIRREENILWSFAPHDVSVILGLVGEMPQVVQAQGGNYLHHRIADVTVSMLSFSSGIKAHIFVSWLHPFKEQKLVVVGDRKMAVFDDLEKKDKLVLYPHAIDWKNHVPVANKADAQPLPVDLIEPLRAECEHFLDCLQTRAQPRTDGGEGLRVLKVLDQCQRSLDARSVSRTASGPNDESDKPRGVHSSAFVDEDVEIGTGTSIWHISHILRGSRIGENCKIGQNVVIGPDVTIGNRVKIQNNVSIYKGVTFEDDVFCGPSAVFTNVLNPRSEIPRMEELRPTVVKRGATIGANSTILCGIAIGEYAFIGAGAVVTKSVPPYALVIGNPARIMGWACICGNKLKKRGRLWGCESCHRCYSSVRQGLKLR